MLAPISPPMPLTTLRTPPPVAAVQSVVPLRFWDGDRLERWKSSSGFNVRRCADGMWKPMLNSSQQLGTAVGDDLIRECLVRQTSGTSTMRYAPRYLPASEALPGRPLLDGDDVHAMTLEAEGAMPFVSSSGPCRGFWSLWDLCAEQGGESAAAHIDPVISLGQMREALAVMLEEHRAEVSIHRPSGRLYARYQTYGRYEDGGRERMQLRTFVYVLAGAVEPR